MITFKHVYKTYSANKHSLRDISLDIKKGEFVFLTGPSGAGKSTLFKLISGFENPSSGELSVLGHDLNKIKSSQIPFLRRKIGFVLQNYKLLKDKTVFENVELPLVILNINKSERHKKVSEMLSLVGLIDVQHQYPEHLSGGEQQRVAIARALIHNPDIVIADEPTGNLDPELSDSILKLFFKLSSVGATFIVATHDPRLIKAKNCRILKLEKGQLVEDQKT